MEISKAYQLTLLESLGLPYPRAASSITRRRRRPPPKGYVPGRGEAEHRRQRRRHRRFDTPAALERACQHGLDLGIDQTSLVQEYVTPADGRIVRVEVLDGKFLYAIRIYTTGDTFNLCPADVCRDVDGAELVRGACPADAPKNSLRVEAHTPPPDIIEAVERIMKASGIEIGGVEYMIDTRDGRPYFYDINALSNFIADAPRVVGFDPFARLADWLQAELVAAGSREVVLK